MCVYIWKITEPFKKEKKKKKKKKLVSRILCKHLKRTQSTVLFLSIFISLAARRNIKKKKKGGKYFVPELSTYEDVGGESVLE